MNNYFHLLQLTNARCCRIQLSVLVMIGGETIRNM